jgi:hypothetical protein
MTLTTIAVCNLVSIPFLLRSNLIIDVLTVKKKRSTLGNPISIDEDGLLLDIDVQPIDNARPTREEKRRDVDEFFHPAVSKVINGKTKSYCICRCCPNEKMLVNEVTTLHCHLEAQHSVSLFFVYLLAYSFTLLLSLQGKYRKWANTEKFESKLPGDIKNRKSAAAAVLQATTLDRHLSEPSLTEQVAPYSDKLFHQVAIEWLVATDQPIRALEHPQFKKMIDVASRATKGVNVPS